MLLLYYKHYNVNNQNLYIAHYNKDCYWANCIFKEFKQKVYYPQNRDRGASNELNRFSKYLINLPTE